MKRSWVGFVVLMMASSVWAADTEDKVPQVEAGASPTMTTTTELKTSDFVKVTLTSEPRGICDDPQTIDIPNPTAREFKLPLPPTMCSGRYKVSATHQDTAADAKDKGEKNFTLTPSTLEVKSPVPVVTAIDPYVFYKGDVNGSIKFLGTGLNPNDHYSLKIDDIGLPECDKNHAADCFKFTTNESQPGLIQVDFTYSKDTSTSTKLIDRLSGTRTIYLVRNGAASAGLKLIVADVPKSRPKDEALVAVGALLVLIYLILSGGRTGLQITKGQPLMQTLFLDEETNSYSLSKIQFFAWTFAAIFGYVFLAISKSVIQGSATFPDIPQGLPGIILASAGTAVVAVGISSAKGSKGAGPDHPTVADLITNGGVVAPERLQFVLWTIVGIVTFLTIVWRSDPVTLSDLPRIPDGFLQLMGISSAGYLAGKLARKPGPVITTLGLNEPVSVDNSNPPKSVMKLHLMGTNLDPKGVVKVDNEALRTELFNVQGMPDPKTGLCSVLDVTLLDAEKYVTEAHKLTFVNTDAQAADIQFPADLMTIEKVPDPVNGQSTVTGTNFANGTKYVWRDRDLNPLDAAGTARQVVGGNPVPANVTPMYFDATVNSATSLTVPRSASIVSRYTLELLSPKKLRTVYKIT